MKGDSSRVMSVYKIGIICYHLKQQRIPPFVREMMEVIIIFSFGAVTIHVKSSHEESVYTVFFNNDSMITMGTGETSIDRTPAFCLRKAH